MNADFQEQARLHIRKWLNENRTSQSELEKAAGMGSGMVTKIINGKKGIGHKSFRRLGAVVGWPAEVESGLLDGFTSGRISQAEKNITVRQPWPVTVRKLKKEKPIYARAWA